MVASRLVNGFGKLFDGISVKRVSRMIYDMSDLVGGIAEAILGLLEGCEFARPPALGIRTRFLEGDQIDDSLLNSRGKYVDFGVEVSLGENMGGRREES